MGRGIGNLPMGGLSAPSPWIHVADSGCLDLTIADEIEEPGSKMRSILEKIVAGIVACIAVAPLVGWFWYVFIHPLFLVDWYRLIVSFLVCAACGCVYVAVLHLVRFLRKIMDWK